jgi:hypothetical protein
MTNTNGNKITFLLAAISDAQALIRLIDTKTAVVITILSGYLIFIFSSIEKYSKFHLHYDYSLVISLLLFFFMLALCLIVTTRIINPTNDPNQNISLGESSSPSLKYFLGVNNYSGKWYYPFCNSMHFKLNETFDSYLKQLKLSEDEELINSLSHELLKVSYIRNIKNSRFNNLLILLLLTSLLFLFAYVVFVSETQKAIIIMDQLKS